MDFHAAPLFQMVSNSSKLYHDFMLSVVLSNICILAIIETILWINSV